METCVSEVVAPRPQMQRSVAETAGFLQAGLARHGSALFVCVECLCVVAQLDANSS